MEVLTVTMRFESEEHCVAEGWDEFDLRRGEEIGLEQCDNCGSAAYRVPTEGRFIVCADEEFDGEVRPGCGLHYPVHWTPAEEAIQ